MINQLPPSIRRQRWGRISLIFIVLFIVCEYISIHFLWHNDSWGAFSQHVELVAEGVWYLIFNSTSTKIDNYINTLKEYGIFDSVVLVTYMSVLGSMFISIILVYRFIWVPGGVCRLVKIGGPNLYEGKALNKALTNHRRKIIEVSKIKVHPNLTLSEKELEGNIFAFGQQGSGKSVVIKQLLESIVASGEQVVIYDEKREYTEILYNPEDTILIAPWDKRSAYWDISKDLTVFEDFELLASRLISGKASEPMWSNGARSIFSGMLAFCRAKNAQSWGWKDVSNALATDDFILRELLEEHYPAAARFVEPNSKTTHSFMSTLLAEVSWMSSIGNNWIRTKENTFSIKQWLNGEYPNIKKLIIQSHPQFKHVGSPLCNSLLGFLTSSMLSKPDGNTSKTWLILDELGNLSRNDSLKEWLSLGRSKGCRCIAGTQSVSQLRDIYGDDSTETILNLFSTIISLRCGAPSDAAEYAAKCFGEGVFERPTIGAEHSKNVINWHKEVNNLVTADHLKHIPEANDGVLGYITSSGWNSVFKLKWPYPNMAKISEGHIPANWMEERDHKRTRKRNGRLRYRPC